MLVFGYGGEFGSKRGRGGELGVGGIPTRTTMRSRKRVETKTRELVVTSEASHDKGRGRHTVWYCGATFGTSVGRG